MLRGEKSVYDDAVLFFCQKNVKSLGGYKPLGFILFKRVCKEVKIYEEGRFHSGY